MLSVDVAIIGGGIAGLVLAHDLEQAGKSVAIVEQSSRVGGCIQTVEQTDSQGNLYLLELGANSTLSTPALLTLASDLGISDQLLYPTEHSKNRYLVCRSRQRDRSMKLALEAAPMGLMAAIKTPILSSKAKLRALLEPLIPNSDPKSEDESVESLITRRFGQEVSQFVVAPMLSGVWAGDITQLSARAALEKLWTAQHSCGSVVRGLIKARKLERATSKEKTPRAKTISFRNGMSTLIDSLSTKISGPILLNRPLEQISPRRDGVFSLLDGSLSASHIAICTPTAAAAKLLPGAVSNDLDLGSTANLIRCVPYAPVGLLYLTVKRSAAKHPLDGFGFLVPPIFGTAIRGALFSSTLFPNRAPEDEHLITCFVGGAPQPDLFDVTRPEVQQRVKAELAPLLGIDSPDANLKVIGAHSWPQAIPNFPVNHFRLQSQVAEINRAGLGLTLLGNWYRGLSVGDRIKEARTAAVGIYASNFEG